MDFRFRISLLIKIILPLQQITSDVIQSNSITDEKIQNIAAAKVEILDTANKITATDAEAAFAEIFLNKKMIRYD